MNVCLMTTVLLICGQITVTLQLCGQTSTALKIAAFNIQVFGQSKVGKADVMAILVKIVSRYDIILIQEIRDSAETAFPKLVDEVNSASSSVQYTYVISARLGRTSSKEQYAFMYKKDVGISVDSTFTYNDDANDHFEREPYLVKFTVQNSVLPVFVLGGIHVKPSDAVAEIKALEDVFNFTKIHFNTSDIIIMGDLNADCSYVSNSAWATIPIKNDPDYHWLIGDDADTTVKDTTTCAYDRFILTGDDFLNAIVTDSAKVFFYDAEYGLNSTLALDVSDHYPIELEMQLQSTNDSNSTTTTDDSVCTTVESTTAATVSNKIRIGAFNVQIFGQTKAGKPAVMSILAQIISRYDIILIQEIRDIAQTAFPKLADEANSISDSKQYEYVVSERVGRTSSKEQYAFLYRKDFGISVVANITFDDGVDDGTDAFEREPYLVKFEVQNADPRFFVLGGIHVKPSDAVAEIKALESVFNFTEEYFNTSDIVIMGDFNADCSYVSNSAWATIPIKSDPNYHWLIGDDADTTVKSTTTCAYDRFILKGPDLLNAVVTNSPGVFLYDTEYGLNSTMALDVSDHYPIEFELATLYTWTTAIDNTTLSLTATSETDDSTTVGNTDLTTTNSITADTESTLANEDYSTTEENTDSTTSETGETDSTLSAEDYSTTIENTDTTTSVSGGTDSTLAETQSTTSTDYSLSTTQTNSTNSTSSRASPTRSCSFTGYTLCVLVQYVVIVSSLY